MKCPRCGRKGQRAFKGYCTKVHRDLEKKPRVTVLECARCGAPVPRTKQPAGKVYCSRCPKNSGDTHPRWREGQYINTAGYRLVLISGEYKLEHRTAWEQGNSACILPQAHGRLSVHHINTNKTDNRPENLVLLSNEVHGRIHRLADAGRWKEAQAILVSELERQAFFVLHPQHLDFYRNTSLKEIMT